MKPDRDYRHFVSENNPPTKKVSFRRFARVAGRVLVVMLEAVILVGAAVEIWRYYNGW